MLRRKKVFTMSLAILMATTVVTTATLSERNIISVFAETEESNDVDVEEDAKPKQVNVHMGEDHINNG